MVLVVNGGKPQGGHVQSGVPDGPPATWRPQLCSKQAAVRKRSGLETQSAYGCSQVLGKGEAGW